MNKEEIRHFKSLLRQGSLRHMNILLDDKFQKELLNIIKDYENLQKQNKELKDNWNKLKEWLEDDIKEYEESEFHISEPPIRIMTKIVTLDKMQEIEEKNDKRNMETN